MRKKLILMTIVPVAIVLIISGVIGTNYTSNAVNRLASESQSNASELICTEINSEIKAYENLVVHKADSYSLKDFLTTVTDRDNVITNEYYSYAIGELDAAISENRKTVSDGFIASFEKPDIIFSNSASGWSGAADFDVTQMPYYELLVNENNDFCITDPYTNPVNNKMIISIVGAVRTTNTNKIIGAFGLNINVDNFKQLISKTSVYNDSIVVVAGSDDTIIYSPYETDVLKSVREARLEINSPFRTLYSFSYRNNDMVGYHGGVDGCNWSIYVMSPRSEITYIVEQNVSITVIIYVCLLAVVVIIMTVMAGILSAPISDYTSKIKKINLDSSHDTPLNTNEILEPKGYYEIEMLAKSFNDLLKRNSEMVSKLREMNLKSERERRLYQTALESSSDVVFEYDIETDKLITYGSFFDSTVPKTQQLIFNSFVAKIMGSADNDDAVKEKAERFFKGDCTESVQICQSYIKLHEKKRDWVVFEGTPVYDNDAAVKIIGKVRNINDVISLKNEAETDALTGFLNKISTQSYIAECIYNTPKGRLNAMALIDIDNFKSINDKLGHNVGDDVLREIASKLRSLFRDSDILGRIGGDEFMAFMKNVSDISTLEGICKRVCTAIKKDFPSKDGVITISCSIGIAIYPDHGASFEELYSKADIAMYHTKTNGKNGYTIYSGQDRVEYKSHRTD